MLLSDYQWSHNPRGLHVAQAFESPPDYQRYIQPKMGWVKLLAAGIEYADDVRVFMDNNITPIVRLYLGRYGAGPFDQHLQRIIDTFVSAGVKWFEFYNEPNVDVEWPLGFDPSWENTSGIISPMMDNWMNFAEYVASKGCYPGFVAMAESAVRNYAAVLWMDTFLNYIADHHYERFRALLANGMYCCYHPLIANHFYQEVPGGGPFSMRTPAAQVGTEGGWHFEYPYDPVSQSTDPGRTVYGGTAETPFGDPNGLVAMGRMFNERCASIFGSQAIPCIGTEGGIIPFLGGGQFQLDTRYPPYNERSQAEATVAMFEWLAREAPPWAFGVCMWKEDEFWIPHATQAIERLIQVPVVYKDVPAIPTMGSGPVVTTQTAVPFGPGPIHGEADFHMILLGPGLETRWFFDTAQAYWNRFRPMVTTHEELIQFIPTDRSLAVTVIATPDTLDLMRSQIAERYVHVWYDEIPAESVEQIAETLNLRVRLDLRFG
ncbi:MAG: hypothetical protein ABI835_16625 [Chloroflexota bacterium]